MPLQRHRRAQIHDRRVMSILCMPCDRNTIVRLSMWDYVSGMSMCLSWDPPETFLKDSMRYAVSFGGHTLVGLLLKAHNFEESFVSSCLMNAVTRDHSKVVETLIPSLPGGVIPEEIMQYCMACAAENSNLCTLSVLIAAGGNPSTVLVSAVETGRQVVIDFLIFSGADIHYSEDAPLVAAVTRGDLDIVSSLIRSGADPDARYGYPVRRAVHSGFPNILKCLLDAGASPNPGIGLSSDFHGKLIKRIIKKAAEDFELNGHNRK